MTSESRLRFIVGDICLHVGGDGWKENERVQIREVGPFPTGTPYKQQTPDGTEFRRFTNMPTDYIIDSLDNRGNSFCLDQHLKPLPPPEQDYIPKWCRELFPKQAPIGVPAKPVKAPITTYLKP